MPKTDPRDLAMHEAHLPEVLPVVRTAVPEVPGFLEKTYYEFSSKTHEELSIFIFKNRITFFTCSTLQEPRDLAVHEAGLLEVLLVVRAAVPEVPRVALAVLRVGVSCRHALT